MKKFFNNIEHASFIDRPNRFLVNCELKGKKITAFLPNPGRLQELLFPGSLLYLTKESPNSSRKTLYTAVGVEKNGFPVMLHTHKANEVVRYLLKEHLIPTLEDTDIIAGEVPYGKSRFDFLLKRGESKIYLEVKSCTLFSEKLAMFPDAITERGRKHLTTLSGMAKEGINTSVIFLIHYWRAEFFLPDYHTDLLFARTFLKAGDNVTFIPISTEWRDDLSLSSKIRIIKIPWEKIETEDRGSYVLLLELKERKNIIVGKLGSISFAPGYYIYVGSGMTNLSQRIKRHYRLRKKHHWHIDFLREEGNVLADFPIRSSEVLECKIAEAISKISDFTVPGFGSSDCNCNCHLFGFRKNPALSKQFISVIQYFRMDRLFM